jgi:predicted phosphohydrolase
MRLVAVADTHLFTDDLPAVPDGDVFVHAGDMCRSGELSELEHAAAWIRSLPHRHKIVVAGNHDRSFEDEPRAARQALGDDVVYLQDAGCELEGVSFWGSPWQPEFHSWAFNLPRGDALAERWARIPVGVDVLVTHGPPAGFGDASSMTGRQGCEDLLARVRDAKPRVHLFGHIHEDGGAWHDAGTWFVNCTTWECERAATVVDITPGGVDVFAPPRGGFA